MEIPISISSNLMSPDELKHEIERSVELSDDELALEIHEPLFVTRGVDAGTLVAVGSAVAPIITALVTGIFQIAKQRAANKIVFHSATTTIEVPTSISEDELDEIIEKVKRLEAGLSGIDIT